MAKSNDRGDDWAKSAKSVLTFVRYKSCLMIILSSPRGAYQTGLFAVVVVTFLPLSFPLLQPSPGVYDTHFRPPHYAVVVNALWLTSLAFSMACALLATLVLQWARSFQEDIPKEVKLNNPPEPVKFFDLAHDLTIYASFLAGVERFLLPAMVDAIPVLLHWSLFLFFGGLAYFLLNINHTIGYMMLGMVASGFLIYAFLTIMPLIIPNSPYQTPLSPFLWYGIEVTIYLGLRPFKTSRWIHCMPNYIYKCQNKIWEGMSLAVQRELIRSTFGTPEKPFDLLFHLEKFLEWLSKFYQDSWLKSLYSVQLRQGFANLAEPVAGELLITCLPQKVSMTDVQRHRLEICLKSIWCFDATVNLHFEAISKQFKPDNSDIKKNDPDPWGPLSAETWDEALHMSTKSDPFIALRSQFIQALMAVMWIEKKWYCASSSQDPEKYLQRQLGPPPGAVIEGSQWSLISRDQLRLTVAANLLFKSLPLLRELEIGKHKTFRMELKEILDEICRNVDTSDVPPWLRARFVNRASVEKVFDDPGHFQIDGSSWPLKEYI